MTHARLEGKVALITGGARGMGAATAKLFAREGAIVVIADVLAQEGQRLATEIGSAARFQMHDVTDESSWRRLVESTLQEHGKIDVLVNNAGIQLFRSLLDLKKEEFEKVLSVNLTGTFLGMRAVAPAMLECRKGSIINVASVEAMKGANGLGAYTASKWGVRGLTKVAALEFGSRGVRVNSIHPGGVDTVMGVSPEMSRKEVDDAYAHIPLRRIGQPEEIAAVSLFLASDESSYMCGAEVVVDGGALSGQYYLGLPGAPDRSARASP